MQGSREGKVRLSTHTFAGMANALTRKEPPHDDQPELMTRAERRRAARKARAAKTWKKVAAGTVAVATLFGGMGVASTALAADRDSYQDTIGNSSFEAARNQYGLTKHMKNGAILHAWMWSFKTITQHMPEIAAAGYTSVQTEPMSKIKEVAANGKKFTENWYYVYQPANTSIGNFVVGTEADLKEMTATAHKYGVRVIVDVVANHFTSDWNAIDPDWQNKEYFHKRTGCDGPNGEINDYSNRYKVTQCHLLGLWDLNTQNQAVADRMQKFLKTAVADGVDGFRYDAAKHVELPTEVFDNKQSNYWNTILKNGSQFQYGEVLQGDSGLDYKAYANMFRDNSSDGGGNTASNYGKTIRAAVGSNNLDVKMVKNIDTGGASEDQLVTWVESHDNYANGDKESTGLTDYQIMMGWAVVGSRRAGAPLYFNRPKGSGGTNPQFAEQSQLGDAGDDMWKNKSVAAVNHFRNAMDGKGENLQNCGDKSCLMIERSTSDGIQNDGVVIANMGGDKSLSGMETTLDDGTYPDEVNGGQLVVSNHKIVSGTAKGGAVSVFYVKGESDPNVSVEAASKEFSSDNVKVTLRAQDADNLKYTTTEGESGSFTDGKVISVGKTLSIGETATVKVTGTAAKDGKKVKKGQALSASVTVKKVEVPKQNLAAQYSTNKVGMGVKKTINFNAGKDASIADWDSSMLIAQGAANDDPRVYRPNSMYEVPIDLYALYGAYDDDNLYLMWEMTNVQDVVDTGDDYPLSQGHLWQTQNLPFHIAIDTKDDSTRIGNNGGLQTGGSLWASNITWGGEQKLNNVVTISTNGSNGPWIYKGAEVVHRHNLRILPRIRTGIAEFALLGELWLAAAGTDRAVEVQRHGLGAGTDDAPAHGHLPLAHAGGFPIAIGIVIMRFHPRDKIARAGGVAPIGQGAGVQVLRIQGSAQLAAVGGCGDAAAVLAVAGEQLCIVAIAGDGILQHFAVLELRAIVKNDVPILGAVILVRQFDVLGRIETEPVHTVVDRLHEEIVHHVGGFGVLSVDVIQAEQLAVGHLIAVVPILHITVIAVVVVVLGLLPTIGDGAPSRGHMVGYHIDDDTHAVLVSRVAQALQIIFGTHHPVADGGVGRLIHVVPVLGEDHALAAVMNSGNRLGLHGGVTGFGNSGDVFLNGFEAPLPCMQGGALAHLLRQSVMLARLFERGVFNGVGVAVAIGAGLCCGAGDCQSAEGGRRGGDADHHFLANLQPQPMPGRCGFPMFHDSFVPY